MATINFPAAATNQPAVYTEDTESVIRPQGQFQGETIILTKSVVSMADMAEELTFAAAEHSDNSLNKRKLRDSNARVHELEVLVAEYLDKVPGLERKEKLKEMVNHLSGGEIASFSQLMAYIGSYSTEVSEQFQALCFARDALAKLPGRMEGTLALIERALASMAEKEGTAILLGARITGPAIELASQGLGEEQALRDSWRDAVQNYQGPLAAWRDINRRFPDSALEGVISFISKEINADLDSGKLVFDHVQLQQAMSDLKICRHLLSIYMRIIDDFLPRMRGEPVNGIRAF